MSRLARGPLTTLITTGLDSLANGGGAISSAFDNDLSYHRFGFADFQLVVDYGSNPTAGSQVELYLIPSYDGTNYGDGTTSVFPVDFYVGGFHLRATTDTQTVSIRNVPLPPGKFKALVKNASGQTTAASGNTVKMQPFYEGD